MALDNARAANREADPGLLNCDDSLTDNEAIMDS